VRIHRRAIVAKGRASANHPALPLSRQNLPSRRLPACSL